MASRAEQKKKLREEREAKERQEREKSAKRAQRMRMLVAAAVVVIGAIVAVVVLSGGSEKKAGPKTPQGLDVSAGPWGTNTAGLEKRVAKLGLPDPSDTVFHIHAQLTVYVNGKKSPVPANIGVDSANEFLASLHSHDTTGVVHMEAVRPYKFTLGQFFTVWGVAFSKTQLGAYHANPAQNLVLQTWVNGKQVPDPVNYAMKSHDRIVVGFGEPDSFPKTSKFEFPAGD
jgi:hypothetical protein